MTTRRVLTFVAIIAGIAALAGCPTGDISAAAIIGSLCLDHGAGGPVPGGIEYHVLLYGPDTVVDLDNLDDPAPVQSMTGTLPGGMDASYTMIQYVLLDVPAGDYFLFAWVDLNDDGVFNGYDDCFGFFEWDPSEPVWTYTMQPADPNVNVPTTGVIDVDFYLTRWSN
jgi:hypothetical protein